jgi:hypothetical protein
LKSIYPVRNYIFNGIQGMVAWMVFRAKAVCASRRELQLERQRLELERESGF